MKKSNKTPVAVVPIAPTIRDTMLAKASTAASLFEARWTLGALLREAPDLHEALEDQIGMFHESLVTGKDKEVVDHGEATCRGWQAAIIAMEKSGIADDAYHVGEFGDTVVMIGRQKKAPEHLVEKYGEGLVWLNPREVAVMYMQIERVAEVKRLWPDAEIVEIKNKREVVE